MPTYAYACTACEHRFEVRQAFTDAALDECPRCRGSVRKLFNTVGIVFKGSGFYRTDSRSGSGTTAPATNGSPSETPAANGSGSGTKAEKKPAAAASSTAGSGSAA